MSENDENKALSEEEGCEDEEQDSLRNGGHTFVASEEKYKDNSSSAFAFLLIGALVIVFLLLCTFNVIPVRLNMSSQPIMYITLWIIAAIFLVVGFISLSRARVYKGQISSEESQEKEITDWFLAAYTRESLDSSLAANEAPDTPNEVLSLDRMNFIHDNILEKYPDLEDAHADALSEALYQKLFENE